LTLLPESLAPAEPGRKQVIPVEDRAEIRRLHKAEGLPIRQIARMMDISRNTVRAAVRWAAAV
jgi:transposase-like protein